MICSLTDLYQKQKELDEEIARNHQVTYESTRNKRTLALLVELGEFANATRTFKYWSNKGAESKERILDEFADGLHFLLSLGIDQGYVVDSIEVNDDNHSLTDTLLATYELTSIFYSNQSIQNYLSMFISYLRCLFKLGYSWEEAKEAYYLKLKENHNRQNTNY
ncbi:MAG: dUTP diphosphatase [Bacilli bacterium]|nr:dUTP diphosphatase [Bacilli bacterium]